ncbi:SEC-C metal-binding domain-containing protein [Streptomyces sp. 900105245]
MSRKHRRTVSPDRAPVSAEQAAARDAAKLEALAAKYLQDGEEILTEAAERWSDAGEHDRALALYEQLLESEPDDPHLIEAFRINTLWDAGLIEQARTAAAQLRRRHPKDAGVFNIVAEMFEAHDQLDDAAEWFTAGLTQLMGPAAPMNLAAVDGHHDPGGIEMLAIGRHRVRRLLGRPHDDADDLADELHRDRRTLLRGNDTLDDLHDPARRPAHSDDPAVLQAEIEQLAAEIDARRQAASRPRMTCALFWPEVEFTQLIARWPAAADAYGTDHRDHTRRIEDMLSTLADDGVVHLGVAHGTITDFNTYIGGEDTSPEDGSTRAAYAADLAARGKAHPWPPPRNSPCWCGSDRKYKKCCGSPATR